MTYHDDFTLSASLLEQRFLEQLTTQGLDALPDLFRVLLNAAMQIERQKHLGAASHERTEQRTGHANGFKDKTLSHSPGTDHRRCPPGARRRLLSTEPGTRHPLRAGLEAGAGRDVCAGRLHPQSGRHHRAALRLCRQQYARSARRPRNLTQRLRLGASGPFRRVRMSTWMPATRKCARQDGAESRRADRRGRRRRRQTLRAGCLGGPVRT